MRFPAKDGARCRLRGVDACRHAGPTVPQSSIVGSTDDCHISPPIAKPKAARQRRADRLPDDVVAHHEAVLEAWFHVSDDRVGRVEMWRGDVRLSMSVPAPFVWRCLSGSAVAPFPHPAHRTGHADFPHPALGQDFTPSFACDAILGF